MKKGKKKDSDNEDSESDQKNHNNKSKKWWLNQSKNENYNLMTHWNVSGKKEKTTKKSDNSDEESSEDTPKRKQKSPFDPPSNDLYQLMTVYNQNKRKKVTKRSKINVDDADDDNYEKEVHINKKNKDFLFSKTASKKRIKEESETESSDNNYVKVQRTPKPISFNSNSIQNEKHSERKSHNSQIERKSRNSVTQPERHSERKSRDYSIHKEKPPERKLKIDFLESLDSDSTEKSNKNSHRKQQLISINKEEICSFYHISDYRIPNNNIFNNSAKPLNLTIIENASHPKFNEELADAEIRLFPNQFDQFFEIVTNHLRTNPNDTKLCMKLLIAVDSVLYYDQAFESLTKSSIIDYLPFSTAKLIILSFKILKLAFMFRPNFFEENFMPIMKHLISILPVEMTLSLFIIYAHSFEYIENPWPILDLLIKEKSKFFHINDEDDEEETTKLKVKKYFNNDPDVEADFIIDDTDESFLSLLFFLNSNFKVYKQHRLKYCRPIFIESMFDPTISKKAALTAYKAAISLYDSEFGDKIGISSLFNDLKDSEFEDLALQILAKMNVDSIPIKNKYILQLINSSHVNEKASLILQKMMSNSQRNGKIASILLDNSKWLKFGLPTFSHTLMIFQSCVRFGNQSLLNNVKNCEEIPLFFKELVHSENINDIQQIPQLIQDIEFDDFKSLSEISFFDSLLDKISSVEEEDDALTFIRLLSDLASIRYSRDFKKFIVVLKKLLKNKNNNEIFHAALKALANLSAYEKCAEQIQDLNVISIAEKNCQSQSDIKLLKKIQKNLS